MNPLVAGKAVSEGKLDAQTLRQLGYDISDEKLADWARISNALDQVKIKVQEIKETPFGDTPVTTTGYNYIKAIKEGLLSADDLKTLGFNPEDVSTMLKTVEMETKLEPYQKSRIDFLSPTFEKAEYTDIGAAIVDGAVQKKNSLI